MNSQSERKISLMRLLGRETSPRLWKFRQAEICPRIFHASENYAKITWKTDLRCSSVIHRRPRSLADCSEYNSHYSDHWWSPRRRRSRPWPPLWFHLAGSRCSCQSARLWRRGKSDFVGMLLLSRRFIATGTTAWPIQSCRTRPEIFPYFSPSFVDSNWMETRTTQPSEPVNNSAGRFYFSIWSLLRSGFFDTRIPPASSHDVYGNWILFQKRLDFISLFRSHSFRNKSAVLFMSYENHLRRICVARIRQ